MQREGTGNCPKARKKEAKRGPENQGSKILGIHTRGWSNIVSYVQISYLHGFKPQLLRDKHRIWTVFFMLEKGMVLNPFWKSIEFLLNPFLLVTGRTRLNVLWPGLQNGSFIHLFFKLQIDPEPHSWPLITSQII